MSEIIGGTYRNGTEAQIQSVLSKSDIFDILRNDRRRHTLELLKKDGNQSLREISEEIARIESGEDAPSGKVRKSVYVSLLQNHLPKMEDMGLIVHNRELDQLELTSIASNMNVYLETVEKGDIPWSYYYLGVSLIGLLGGTIISYHVIEFINDSQWLFFITVIFLTSSLVHLKHTIRLKK